MKLFDKLRNAWENLHYTDTDRAFHTREKVRSDVAALSMDQAEALAATYLEDRGVFEPVPPQSPEFSPLESCLSPSLKQFFQQYPAMNCHYFGASWDRSLIEESGKLPGFLNIARADDQSDLLVNYSSDEVSIFHKEDDVTEDPEEQFISIYHFVVFLGRICEPLRAA